MIQKNQISKTTPNETGNNEEFENMIRKVSKEELEDHEKNLVELLKSHLGIKNKRLDQISEKVLGVSKSFCVNKMRLMKDVKKVIKY